ncbi:hypothetical protein E2562_036704, partial [Oryza meyeriana var. granulata]
VANGPSIATRRASPPDHPRHPLTRAAPHCVPPPKPQPRQFAVARLAADPHLLRALRQPGTNTPPLHRLPRRRSGFLGQRRTRPEPTAAPGAWASAWGPVLRGWEPRPRRRRWRWRWRCGRAGGVRGVFQRGVAIHPGPPGEHLRGRHLQRGRVRAALRCHSAADEDGYVGHYDTRRRLPSSSSALEKSGTCIQELIACAQLIVTGSRDGSFALWDLRCDLKTPNGHREACLIIVKIWDTRNIKLSLSNRSSQEAIQPSEGVKHGISCLSQDSYGAYIVVPCMDNSILQILRPSLHLDHPPQSPLAATSPLGQHQPPPYPLLVGAPPPQFTVCLC